MSDQGEMYENSWILYHILDRSIGNRDSVAVRKKLTVVGDQLLKSKGSDIDSFSTGSRAEGFEFPWSDRDVMIINSCVVVLRPDQDISDQHDTANKSVLKMRNARSRPGYVNLELLHLAQNCSQKLMQSIVAVGDAHFVSSEIYRQACTRPVHHVHGESHGPAINITMEHGDAEYDYDRVVSFPCYEWPSEANESMKRPRLHNWPDKALRDQIVQGGCHLVPVGDKTSAADQSLQWRISFTTAERKLIHSLTYFQFLVYGLFKCFLKQISGMLDQMLDGTDILSSYIIKTIILYAVESTSESFWQEKHMFLCFMFCLKILVNWVKAGYCPNYFIKKNNMFLGKVHGENQQKLLRYLTELHDMNWKCLSVGTAIQPNIGERIRSVRNGEWEYYLPPPIRSERERDFEILRCCDWNSTCISLHLPVLLKLLSASKSDTDEFIAFYGTGHSLSFTGMEMFGKHITAKGNKERYKSLRKCKNLLSPLATVCSSPGLLGLATYYYKIGNYMRALEMCDPIMYSSKHYISGTLKNMDFDRYEHIYCGRGHNLLHKCQAFVTDMSFSQNALQFFPSQFQQVVTLKHLICPPQLLQFLPPNVQQQVKLLSAQNLFLVPPVPYAAFLSFLCYHELGDTRRRATALTHLQTVKHDVKQGVNNYWIVHNLLGVCYEMVGDTHRALREYRESLGVRSFTQFLNPARELIERLQHSH